MIEMAQRAREWLMRSPSPEVQAGRTAVRAHAVPEAASLRAGNGTVELEVPHDEEPTSVVVRYVRGAYWMTFAAMACLSLSDLLTDSPFLTFTLVTRAVTLATSGAMLWPGLRTTSLRSATLAALGYGAVVLGATLWQDSFTGDPVASALAAVGLSLGAAWTLPWPIFAQAALAVLGMAAIIGARAAAGLGTGVVVPLVLTAGSVPMAVLANRQRAALTAARSAARQAGEQLYRIAENADEVLWVFDLASSSIVYISPGVEALCGISAEAIRAQPDVFLRLIHPDDRERVAQHISESGAMTAPARIDHRIRRTDGTVRWVQLRLVPIRNDAGRVVRLGGVIRDRTAEWELADAERRARESAEATAALKDRFLANMSHEIRTPLHGLIGTVDLLAESGLLPVQRAQVETIHACSKQLLFLVNDLLDFSKIEAGTVEVAHVDLDVGDIVAYVVQLFGACASEKGIGLSYAIDVPPFAVFRGDPEILRQILTNLVANAVKFTDTGHIVVRASVAEDTGSHVVLRFEVEDTGIGVAPAAQAGIFEPFIQADASTSRRFGGSGLGLAIAQRLARLVGGEIQLRSTVGRGSTFGFVARIEHLTTEAADDCRLPAKRVLVAAAAGEVPAGLTETLTRWHLRVQQVSSVEAAREALRIAIQLGTPYDLLVADTAIPGMAAAEFIRGIRQAMPNGTRAIGFISSAGRPDDGPAACAAGAAFYLPVPARPRRLLDCLQALWDSSGGRLPDASRLQPLRHILIVEDNPLNQRMAVAMIEWVGYRAEVAASGKEALEALQRRRFDAVLMDCQLPDMDGFETTERIRERERGTGRRIPVIALTASATQAARQRCLAAGMDDYLSKPIQRPILTEVLARWTSETDRADTSNGQIIDRACLQAVTNGDPAQLERYTRMFHDEITAGMREINDGTDNNDSERVLATLHRLKGAAACVGAVGVFDTLARLEDEVRSNGLAYMRVAADLDDAYRRFSDVLQR